MRVRGRLRAFRAPLWQLGGASAVMVGGAYLIAVWMVGVVLMVAGLLWAVDGVFRHVKDDDESLDSHKAILRRYERSP